MKSNLGKLWIRLPRAILMDFWEVAAGEYLQTKIAFLNETRYRNSIAPHRTI